MSGSPTQAIAARIRALADLNVRELRERFEEVCRRPTRSDNRDHLTHGIVRALCEADPPRGRNQRRAVARAVDRALAPRRKASRPHDPRIPPVGSTLRRRLHGRPIEVRVTNRGFVYEGDTYASLSAIAREVTGARWNGLLFFGLTTRKRGAPAGRQP